jgi:sugar/nucleoside kinase (ribokinase family)
LAPAETSVGAPAWDVAGLGNALMDALVVLDDDSLLDELGYGRGTFHPVDHARWTEVYERVRLAGVVFDSGGSCANTIATVGRLGGAALFCGQVGDDQMGRLYGSLLDKACGSHRLQFTRETATGKCLSIISRKDAERTMLTDLGAATLLRQLSGYEAELARARIAHFEGYTLLDSPMKEAAAGALRSAAAAGVTVSLDASDPFVCNVVRSQLWEVLREHVDIVFLNADEARTLAGVDDPVEGARKVAAEAHVPTVVVKLGRKGSLVLHGGEAHPIEVVPVQAVDTTGAGDSYAGGFLYGWARGFGPARCGRLGSAVAALAVAQVGAVVKDHEALAAAIARSA